MEILKLLNTSEIAAQIINFLILLLLLRLFFWKRILALLDERKMRIASEFKKIEDTKQEVEKLKLEYTMQLSHIEETSKEKLRQTIEEGKKIIGDMKKEAHIEALKLIDSAKQDIQYKISKAKEEIKDEIVDLVIKSTQNLVSAKFTEEEDKKLIENFLKEIDKTQ